MPTTSPVRRALGALVGLLALGLCVVGVSAVWGLSVEYDAGLQVLPLAVGLPTCAAAFALLLWPGVSTRTMLVTALLLAAVLLGAGLVADRLGLAEREERALAASERMGCNGPNAEIRVDPRVDEVFAELPRPTTLYGPIEGSADGCTAGVSGGPGAFDQWAPALRDLPGWRVTRDRVDVLELRRRDGITVTLARGDVTRLRVATASGGAVGHSVDGTVSGTNRSRG